MRVLREPLIQFLVLGAGLFGAYVLFAPAPEPPRERIVIDRPVMDSLERGFEAVWNRPPTAAERSLLVEDYLAEELLYREGLKLGLDRDDVVIRRRMRQKMEFLLQDGLAMVAPGEADLRAFHEAEQERYWNPDRISFEQLDLGSREGTDASGRWEVLAVRLNASTPFDPDPYTKPSLLPPRMEAASPDEIDRVFGAGFAEKIEDLADGRWHGPFESAFGWHLVRLESVERGGPLPFEAARSQVEQDLTYRRREDAERALIERLKQRYEIELGEAAQ
jgi:hypothetical protein